MFVFQMLDMIGPNYPNMISLSDLRNCPMTPIFFDTFFNLEKYLDHEQRDPFASQRDVDEDGEDDEVAGDPDGGDRRHDHAVDEAAREVAALKHHRHYGWF